MNKHTNPAHNEALTHQQEYSIIRADLYKVLALNAAYLAIILVLYFTNRNSHYLENWFAKILHF